MEYGFSGLGFVINKASLYFSSYSVRIIEDRIVIKSGILFKNTKEIFYDDSHDYKLVDIKSAFGKKFIKFEVKPRKKYIIQLFIHHKHTEEMVKSI